MTVRLPLALLPLAFLVAGCAERAEPVTLMVSQPCIDRRQLPAEVPPAGPLPEDSRQAADLLAAMVLELRANERLLRALALPCTY